MLMNFTLSNYRSFDVNEYGEGISLIRDNIRSKPDHVIQDNLLKTAMIFGPNASGKSNIINGLTLLRDLVTKKERPMRFFDDFPVCHITKENENKPIHFEICFQVNGSEKYTRIHKHSSKRTLPLNNTYRYILELRKEERRSQSIIYEKLEILNGDIFNCVYEYDSDDNAYGDQNSAMNSLSEQRAVNDEEIYKLNKEFNKISELSDKYAKIRNELSNLTETLQALEIKYKICDKSDENLCKILEAKIERSREYLSVIQKQERQLKIELENLRSGYPEKKEKMTGLIRRKNELNMRIHNSDRSYISSPVLSDSGFPISRLKGILKSLDEEIFTDAVDDAQGWFQNTLEILSPESFIIDLNDPNNLENISGIISKMDVGIKNLDWQRMDKDDEIEDFISSLSYDERDRISKATTFCQRERCQSQFLLKKGYNIYQLTIGPGVLVIDKLVAFHHDGSSHDLCEESDGSRRVIELASILLPSNSPKVYVVDELDCRIHPLLVKYFMNAFFDDRYGSSENKQLIFTTHEIGLLTTEMFRLDEIWFVDHDESTGTHIHSACDYKKSYNAKLSKMYLEKKAFGGVPYFKEIKDLITNP